MSKARLLLVARFLFLGGAIAFTVWGLQGQWEEIGAALTQVSVLSAVVALLAVVIGLWLTGFVWRTILAAYGHFPPSRQARSIFFVGQLGKYIPGSVWSLGAQAQMAERFSVPARTTVSTGLIFLLCNIATAVPVGVLGIWVVSPDPPVAGWIAALAVLAALLCLLPPVLSTIGRLLARRETPKLGWRAKTVVSGLLVATWGCYGVATALLLPAGSGRLSWAAELAWATSAFCLSYVVGVLVVFAPAGLGAREIAVALLLGPSLGVPAAAAAALLTRVAHTVADFGLAWVTWYLGRRADSPEKVNRQGDEAQNVRRQG